MEAFAGVATGSLMARSSVGYKLPKPWPYSDNPKHSLFVFGEIGLWHFVGSGSGRTVESLLGGVRYRTCLDCRIEPFGHLMAGIERPSRPDFDPATKFSFAGGVGLGFDVEINVSDDAKAVSLVRFQIDMVESSARPGFDHHGRAVLGYVFRWETH